MRSNGALHLHNLRERRRAEGIRETTVWVPETVLLAVEELVREGRFATKKEAMSKALETYFLKEQA